MDWVKGFLALWVVLHAPINSFAEGEGGQVVLSREEGTVVTLETVTPKEALEKIKAGALVVDVRSPEEFSNGHLDNAVNVPHTTIAQNIALFGADKAREIVLYCRSGRRSGLALVELKALGFTNVVNAGGYSGLVGAK